MRSTFAFQPWHSLIEFKRYCLQFDHEVPKLINLGGVWRSPFNQYDSIIAPITKWFKEQGVNFEFSTEVTRLDFEVAHEARSIYRIHLSRAGASETIEVAKSDRVFVTLGSMTAASSIRSMEAPAPAIVQSEAEQVPTLWTVTCYDDSFFKRYVEWSTNQPGTSALVTFKHSKWDQLSTVKVFWGYGLFPDEVGNFVKKPMKECSGAEIMTEVIHMLAFESDINVIMKNSVCIPSMLRYTMSQFVKRSNGDRPAVMPKNATNFAFLGQFVEVPNDVVFTVEYSVRCAQIAVFKFCSVDREKPYVAKIEIEPEFNFRD
ncbi:UNVERIFIED_CONTAM: hypothetical protein HDU68_012138 [Siphonaria sp. JEL0065]|nr:hypothetical protein HDU68_012138 [Siphonaria sp. JEL0065]